MGYALKAKIFHSHFGHGDGKRLLDTAYALPQEDGRFSISAPSGKVFELAVGDFIPGASGGREIGPVEYSAYHSCLHAGPYAIPIGQVSPGWSARALDGKRRYLVQPPGEDSRTFPVTLGEVVRQAPGVPEECAGQTPWLDEHGNLRVGIAAKPAVKEYELNLLVLDKRERKNGYLAYFNVLEPGSKANRKDGVRGIFFPPRGDQQPAAFCELNPSDQQLYRTAIFWRTRNNRYVSGQYRSLAMAVDEKQLYKQIEEIQELADDLEVEAADAGISLEEDRKRLEGYNAAWNQALFTCYQGQSMFQAPEPGRDMGSRPKPSDMANGM